MTPTHILACDPGLQGAFCFYTVATKGIHVFDMPVKDGEVDAVALADLIERIAFVYKDDNLHAVVERVGSMPRQAGAFNFGRSAGVVHGVLAALGIPYNLVSPVVWKGAMGLRKMPNETQDQNKTRARELAMKLWPGNAGEFKRVKDDGRAEAALLAYYFAHKKGQEK